MWAKLNRWWRSRKRARQARSTDPTARLAAARGLATLDSANAVDLLAILFRDADAQVAEAATEALVARGSPAVDPLLASLHGSDPGAAERAARALGRVGDRRATGPLLSILKFAPHELRLTATRVLEQLPEPDMEALVAGLQDDYPYVRNAAGQILVQHGVQAIPPLLTALRTPDAGWRRQAAVILGKIGDGRSREGLTACLNDADAEVRQAAAEALAHLR